MAWFAFPLVFVVAACVYAQDGARILPAVLEHQPVFYPPLAKETRISGDVRVRITTDGKAVVKGEAISGHPLLRQAAVDNVKTWKFVTHTPGVFEVVFRYLIYDGDSSVEFLTSPGLVRISALPPPLIIDYAWLSLGRFEVRLKSAYGKSQRQFRFDISGPEDDWLRGETPSGDGNPIETDYGYHGKDFLAFSIALPDSNGKNLMTYFIGKIAPNEKTIVGTFVDETGARGQWSARRLPDELNSKQCLRVFDRAG